MIPYEQKLARVLDRMGGLYRLPDILERVHDGRMQSFVEGNSWLVTEIQQFPRGRTFDWVMAVGDLDDCLILHERALKYAEKLNIPLMRSFGRKGWNPDAEKLGWRIKTVNQIYHHEL